MKLEVHIRPEKALSELSICGLGSWDAPSNNTKSTTFSDSNAETPAQSAEPGSTQTESPTFTTSPVALKTTPGITSITMTSPIGSGIISMRLPLLVVGSLLEESNGLEFPILSLS